jgi:hypothetical protein
MNEKVLFKIRIYFTGAVTIFMWSLLLWDYYHGGVPTHHLLHRKDMPGFSNGWGGLLLPLLTWFLLYRVHKRIRKTKHEGSAASAFPIALLFGFGGALLFGIILSTFFTIGNTEAPLYMLIGLLPIALCLPIYRAECLLGFVLGMVVTFGGVLPIIIGSILALLGALLYLFVRPVIVFLATRIHYVVSADKHKKDV